LKNKISSHLPRLKTKNWPKKQQKCRKLLERIEKRKFMKNKELRKNSEIMILKKKNVTPSISTKKTSLKSNFA
jgi:hypothetical protein